MEFSLLFNYLFFILHIIGDLLIWIVGAQIAFTTFGTICSATRILIGKKIKPETKKVVVITGATAGFGLMLTKHFYNIGFSVVAGYFNDQESGYKELDELRNRRYNIFQSKPGGLLSHEPHIFLIKVDVRNTESIENFRNQVMTLIQGERLMLYALINNAGIGNVGAFEWMSTDSISDVIDTNLKGAMQVTRQFTKDIIKNKGRIVNVSSCTYLFPGRGFSAYGTTKAGVTSFSELLDEDLKLHAASCCCIMAGNFVSVSDIVYTLFRSVQHSIKRLSEEERTIFKRSIQEQNDTVTKLLKKKLNSEKREPEKIAVQFKIDLPSFDREETNLLDLVKDWLYKLISPLDGRSKTLESSNLAHVFELAICLKDPPARLYAGNSLYTYLLGPSMEFMAPFSRLQLKPLINKLVFRV